MRCPPDSDIPPNNHASHHTTTNSKLKILTINVNGLNNASKRNKIFNLLKTKKVDITLLQEIHSTKITERQWQKEWTGISFWIAESANQTAGVTILFNEKFQGKIQNIKNNDLGRITSITFTLNE